jgi:hypothetical protein
MSRKGLAILLLIAAMGAARAGDDCMHVTRRVPSLRVV